MSLGPVLRVATAGILRGRLRSLVVFIVVIAASAAATLGVTLYTSANIVFKTAFVNHHGAQLAVLIDSDKVTTEDLVRTEHLPQTTESAGPYPATTITLTAPQSAARHRPRAGVQVPTPPPATLVGRASPNGLLDNLTLNQGKWPSRQGEIATAPYYGLSVNLGTAVTANQLNGRPELTVVGNGMSVGADEDAWVTPAEITSLERAGAPKQEQMLYTFHNATSWSAMTADLKAIEAALPPGAVVGSVSWLESEYGLGGEQGINTPFVLAFALLALGLAVLITASVVTAIVVAGYRRIAILKSIGFTPVQVTSVYLLQIALPTMLGAASGVAIGERWVYPMINYGAGAFQVAQSSVPLWITLAAPIGICLIVGLAALVPAARAARMSPMAAIAAAQTPHARRGLHIHRILTRLPAPSQVTIGLSAPFSRPGRSLLNAAVIAFGVAAVILAVGLSDSLNSVKSLAPLGQGEILITPSAGQGAFTIAQLRDIDTALKSQPGTEHFAGSGSTTSSSTGFGATVAVTNQPFALSITAYTQQSGWLRWPLVAGRWYRTSGEVVVNGAFLAQTGLHVGDTATFTSTHSGHRVTARIVGEIFIYGNPAIYTSTHTFPGGQIPINRIDIQVTPQTNRAAYLNAVSRQLGPRYSVALPLQTSSGAYGLADTALFRSLTIIIAALAAIGVLNIMIMVVHERVHELGIVKALGMTPWQTITMVLCWSVAPAIGAAIVAVPAALGLHQLTIHVIGNQLATGVTPAMFHVYNIGELLLLALTGLALAILATLAAAIYAAWSPSILALHAE